MKKVRACGKLWRPRGSTFTHDCRLAYRHEGAHECNCGVQKCAVNKPRRIR